MDRYLFAISLFLYAAILSVGVYLTIAVVMLRNRLRTHAKQKKSSIRRVLLFCLIVLLIVTIPATIQVIKAIWLVQINEVSNILITVIVVAIYLLGNRYPEFVHILKLQLESAQYNRSQIKDVDTDAVISNLHDILDNEKLFCNDDTSLAGLARRLQVSSHQLSEILNNRMKKSFYQLINEYRVKEAQKVLIESPHLSVSSVAYEV